MQALRWVDGLLVCMNTLAPPTRAAPAPAASNADSPGTIKKAFARVFASNDIAAGHISGHKNLLVAVLGLHRLSRLRIQPMASEDSARSISRIYLRRHKSADDYSDSAAAKLPSLSELGASLALWSAAEHGCMKRPIPMLNGSIITLGEINYSIYFNLEFEDEIPPQQQQHNHQRGGMNGGNDAMAFSQIANMLPSMPGMPDMGAIDTLREAYNRAMDARQLSIASGSRPAKPLEEQMSSQDMFFVDPNSVKEIVQSMFGPAAQRVQRFRLGEPMDFDLEAETAGMATEVPPVSIKEIGGLDKEIKAAMDHVASIVSLHKLKRSLTQESALFSRGALFIHGQHGAGKSMLANAIATHFAEAGPEHSCAFLLHPT